MTAALPTIRPTLAKEYDFIQDPAGWMLSEKLDGIRAIWNGETLTSREGNPINAPDWFTADLPEMALDGELFIGRGRFQETLSQVRSGKFEKVKFMVFDAQEVPGTFASRIATIAHAIAGCAHARPVLHMDCKSREHFRKSFQAITAAGGEGVIIRDPSSKYRAGRSIAFLKLKKVSDDEGELLSHDGKSMLLAWGGMEIKVPMPSNLRSDPPKIGSKITFKFNGLTDSGIPRHASFLTVRNYE